MTFEYEIRLSALLFSATCVYSIELHAVQFRNNLDAKNRRTTKVVSFSAVVEGRLVIQRWLSVSLWFYDHTGAEDESWSHLRAIDEKHVFWYFVTSNMSTERKTNSKFSRVSLGEIP